MKRAVKRLRCGGEEAVSETQRICMDCLLKVTSKTGWRDAEPGNLMTGWIRPAPVEDYRDVKTYKPTEKALTKRR